MRRKGNRSKNLFVSRNRGWRGCCTRWGSWVFGSVVNNPKIKDRRPDKGCDTIEMALLGWLYRRTGLRTDPGTQASIEYISMSRRLNCGRGILCVGARNR